MTKCIGKLKLLDLRKPMYMSRKIRLLLWMIISNLVNQTQGTFSTFKIQGNGQLSVDKDSHLSKFISELIKIMIFLIDRFTQFYRY